MPAMRTVFRPKWVTMAMGSPMARWCLAAKPLVTATSPVARGTPPASHEPVSKRGSPLDWMKVGAPLLLTSLPPTNTAVKAWAVPSAYRTPGTRRTRARVDAGMVICGARGVARLAERHLRGDHDRRLAVRGAEDVVEGVVDLVGEHVRAADHGHAEQDGDDGEGRPQSTAEEAAQGDADHRGASAISAVVRAPAVDALELLDRVEDLVAAHAVAVEDDAAVL